MFPRLFARRRRNESIAYSLYGAIVAQARSPALYTTYQVPDTVDGRFDMIVLHAFLFLHRMRGTGPEEKEIGQAVFDLFLRDMDRSLREMGVSDVGVPKKLKKMAEAFYGRVGAYDTALVAGDRAELTDAIARNVFPEGGGEAAAPSLADYVERAAASLAEKPVADILAGRLAFPELAGASGAVAA